MCRTPQLTADEAKPCEAGLVAVACDRGTEARAEARALGFLNPLLVPSLEAIGLPEAGLTLSSNFQRSLCFTWHWPQPALLYLGVHFISFQSAWPGFQMPLSTRHSSGVGQSSSLGSPLPYLWNADDISFVYFTEGLMSVGSDSDTLNNYTRECKPEKITKQQLKKVTNWGMS